MGRHSSTRSSCMKLVGALSLRAEEPLHVHTCVAELFCSGQTHVPPRIPCGVRTPYVFRACSTCDGCVYSRKVQLNNDWFRQHCCLSSLDGFCSENHCMYVCAASIIPTMGIYGRPARSVGLTKSYILSPEPAGFSAGMPPANGSSRGRLPKHN